MDKKLGDSAEKEIISVRILNTLHGWIIYPSRKDQEARDKLTDSLNFLAGKILDGLLKKDIDKGDLDIKERSKVLYLLQTISKNDTSDYPCHYGKEDLDKLHNIVYSGENLNNFKRVAIVLMYFLQNTDKASLNNFKNDVLCKINKSNEYLKKIGNEKKFTESYTKYKGVGHFILSMAILKFDQIFVESMPPKSYDSKTLTQSCYDTLYFFLELAEYFKQKLLELKTKNNPKKKKKFISEEDFIDVNEELKPLNYPYNIEETSNLDRSNLFDKMFGDEYSKLKGILKIN